jgi:hypothetical protein
VILFAKKGFELAQHGAAIPDQSGIGPPGSGRVDFWKDGNNIFIKSIRTITNALSKLPFPSPLRGRDGWGVKRFNAFCINTR